MRSRKFPALKFHWYDGGLLPERPEELEPERRLPESGTIFVGDKGKLISETYSESPRLIPESRMKAYKRPKKTIPRITGSHEQNWIDAIRGKTKPTSLFDYAGPFTETVLLGNLGVLFPGTKLAWDGPNMKVTNVEKAQEFVQHHYREGWSLQETGGNGFRPRCTTFRSSAKGARPLFGGVWPLWSFDVTTTPSLTRFAWLSITAAIVTMTLKAVAYLLTGSAGLLSDALESVVNLAGAMMALGMLTVAARPAGEDRSFGHNKAEYFSSGVEGGLILIAAVAIAVPAIGRLSAPAPIERIGPGLVALAVAVNIVWTGIQIVRQSIAGLMDTALPPDERGAVEQALKRYEEMGVRHHALRTR